MSSRPTCVHVINIKNYIQSDKGKFAEKAWNDPVHKNLQTSIMSRTEIINLINGYCVGIENFPVSGDTTLGGENKMVKAAQVLECTCLIVFKWKKKKKKEREIFETIIEKYQDLIKSELVTYLAFIILFYKLETIPNKKEGDGQGGEREGSRGGPGPEQTSLHC